VLAREGAVTARKRRRNREDGSTVAKVKVAMIVGTPSIE
jgi:hypothetical protein